jgi:hypothetical protein
VLHGTTYDNCDKIVKSGFDPRKCGRSMYGAWAYFASQAYKSHQNMCRAHANGCKCLTKRSLILERVALGDPYYTAEVLGPVPTPREEPALNKDSFSTKHFLVPTYDKACTKFDTLLLGSQLAAECACSQATRPPTVLSGSSRSTSSQRTPSPAFYRSGQEKKQVRFTSLAPSQRVPPLLPTLSSRRLRKSFADKASSSPALRGKASAKMTTLTPWARARTLTIPCTELPRAQHVSNACYMACNLWVIVGLSRQHWRGPRDAGFFCVSARDFGMQQYPCVDIVCFRKKRDKPKTSRMVRNSFSIACMFETPAKFASPCTQCCSTSVAILARAVFVQDTRFNRTLLIVAQLGRVCQKCRQRHEL